MIRTLLRFLAIGALLWTGQLLWNERVPSASVASENRLLSDDEVLFREALARGYHESDAIVRRRLARNMRFTDPDPAPNDAQLVRQALDLGMHETDLVVRRRLAQRVRLEARHTARLEEPSEAELRAHLERHPERFTQPARVRFFQVFLADPERAPRVAGELPGAPDPGGAWRKWADALPLPQEPPSLSEAEAARLFGPDFAAAVMSSPAGRWSGPIASAYGSHFVYVRAHTPARLAELDEVRSQVLEALLAERGDAALERELASLRARH